MQNPFDKFCATLKSLFMLDVADELDFGIYRIMNIKRRDIEEYLSTRLRDVVKEEIDNNISSDFNKKEKELEDAIHALKEQEMTEAQINEAPKVKRLREELKACGNPEEMQAEVFTHLNLFFSRYYDKGDFISMRRYKQDVYAIPYEGQEVKLHWANADQYYIKTGEYFRNYRFRIAGNKWVEFTLKDLSQTELNNNKAQKEQERRFALYAPQPLEVTEDGTLHIYFTYELMPKSGNKQETLMKAAFDAIKEQLPQEFWGLITTEVPTTKNPHRTLLQKHLKDYSERHTSDYFIHKNLKAFLSRELDFYIKNEVLYIDDITTRNPQTFLSRLAVIKAMQRVGGHVIALLSQLEDYQKRLWLKKKFVVAADYCITIDRIPTAFYADICANDRQREEWVDLFAINEIETTQGDMFSEGRSAYSEPLTEKFLTENPHLVLDTAFFSTEFKQRLLASIDNIDEACNGLLVNSENFQALELLQEKYKEQVKCIYIDPPYNTGGDDFVYKDNYQESSWLSCINDRLLLCRSFFADGGLISVSIDIKELDKLIALLDSVIGAENRKANITVRRASITGAKVINPGLVNISENVVMYANGNGNWKPQDAYREKGYDNRYGKMILNVNDDPQSWKYSTVLDEFSKSKGVAKSQLKKALGDAYADELLNFVIENASSVIRLAALDEDSVSKEVVKISRESKKNPNKIYFLPREDGLNDYYILNGQTILFYKDRLRRIGDRLVPVEKVSDIWDDVLPNDIHNEGGVVLKKGKKPEKLIGRIFEATTNANDLIMDYFAGSATSGAVALKSNRKFINIEANEYFDSIPLRRIKNTLFGDKSGVTDDYQWKGGGMVKYLRLEQYEDTLNNIQLAADPTKPNLGFDESYLLGYMLDVESRDSLFSKEWFTNPFDVKMLITRNNERKEEQIDLVETFNYLLGLKVERTSWPTDGVQLVWGTTRKGERTLVVWRNVTKVAGDALAEAVKTLGDELKKMRRIYVNGDNNLAALLPTALSERIVLTEPEFKKRMFDAE